jgi:hypothetical protein
VLGFGCWVLGCSKLNAFLLPDTSRFGEDRSRLVLDSYNWHVADRAHTSSAKRRFTIAYHKQ